MKKLKLIAFICLGMFTAALTGCDDFNPNDVGTKWNKFLPVLLIIAGAVLVFFLGYAIISVFYKGKIVNVKILKKEEPKGIRGSQKGSPGYGGQKMSRRERRQKERLNNCKITVELDGDKKKLKCNDLVIVDKLSVGKIYRLRVKFNEIVKIMKN